MPIVTDYNDLDSTAIAATLVESLDNIELIQISNDLVENETLNSSFFSLEECSGNDNMDLVEMRNLPIAVDSENIPANEQMNCDTEYTDSLDMGDYKVELMDQFSSDCVEFSDDQLNTVNNPSNLGIYDIDDGNSKPNDIVLSYLCPDDVLFEDLPFEVMEAPAKPTSSKECLMQSEEDTFTEYEKICRSLDNTQFESYQNWLDSVIETMNLVLDFNKDGHPEPLKFSVPHVRICIQSFSLFWSGVFTLFVRFQLYFEIFRTKFSAGTKKKRMPNFTTILTDGRYKNLTLFTWIFSNMKLIKHIFNTKSVRKQCHSLNNFNNFQLIYLHNLFKD